MANEQNRRCEECSSDASCHDNGFTDRVLAYQRQVLAPALYSIGGAHLLPEHIRSYAILPASRAN